MIAFIVWFAMQGQVQQADDFVGHWTTDLPQYHLKANNKCQDGQDVRINTPEDIWDIIAVCKDGYYRRVEAKPAEHVIEIKTVRRWTHRINYCRPPVNGDISTQDCGSVPESKGCPNGAVCTSGQTQTRELWIDGAKFGVIKGLE